MNHMMEHSYKNIEKLVKKWYIMYIVWMASLFFAFGVVLGFAGIFRYVVKISKKKIEVSPAKSNPNLNDKSGKD